MNLPARFALRDAVLTALRHRPAVMGILNVTPDSFSDGGRLHDIPAAIDHGRAMARAGAHLIDVGGESTRPGAAPVSLADEWARISTVIAALCRNPAIAVSVDTYKAAVARQAVELGAVMVNDVWGLQRDPAMADTVAETGAAVVIMHNQVKPDPDCDIVARVKEFFQQSLNLAERAGIARERILLDPGIGFGKTQAQNLTCLGRLGELQEFGLPILLGASRKSFIGHVLGAPIDERLPATLHANLIGLMQGVNVIRVHDVAAHIEMIRLLSAIRASAIQAAAASDDLRGWR